MENDFAGYMDNLAAVEADEAEQQAMFDAHEIWRQTTWGGWTVRKIQAFQTHFRPFLRSALDLVNDEESVGQIILFNFIRLLCIFIVIGATFALAKVFQKFIGNEYIIEEEMVIVHEHKSEEEARKAIQAGVSSPAKQQQRQNEDADAEQKPATKRDGRGKKSKTS